MTDGSYMLQVSFLESANLLPKEIRKKVFKQLNLFSRNPNHPSLHRETLGGKMAGLRFIRVDEKCRIILQQHRQATTLIYVAPHDDAYRFAERIPADSIRYSLRDQIAPSVHEESAVYEGSRPEPPGERRVPPFREDAVTRAPVALETVESLFLRTRKYLPLARFFLSVPTGTDSVHLTFSEIERIIGAPLPASARQYRPWWANNRSYHVQALAWLAVGWKVAGVQIEAETVTFRRA